MSITSQTNVPLNLMVMKYLSVRTTAYQLNFKCNNTQKCQKTLSICLDKLFVLIYFHHHHCLSYSLCWLRLLIYSLQGCCVRMEGFEFNSPSSEGPALALIHCLNSDLTAQRDLAINYWSLEMKWVCLFLCTRLPSKSMCTEWFMGGCKITSSVFKKTV